jgi:hypothetical protein
LSALVDLLRQFTGALSKEHCPMPETYRPSFTVTDSIVKAALDPLLLEHRARIFRGTSAI